MTGLFYTCAGFAVVFGILCALFAFIFVIMRIIRCISCREWRYYSWDVHDFFIDLFWAAVVGALIGLIVGTTCILFYILRSM